MLIIDNYFFFFCSITQRSVVLGDFFVRTFSRISDIWKDIFHKFSFRWCGNKKAAKFLGLKWSELQKKETHNHVNNVQQMHDGEEKNVMDVVSLLPTQLVAFIFFLHNYIEVAVSFIPLKVLNERRRNKKKHWAIETSIMELNSWTWSITMVSKCLVGTWILDY